MTTAPGADEVRARRNLLRVLDGERPAPPPTGERARDWLDDILDEKPTPAPPVAPRLPDWRKGETADLTPPPAPDSEQPAEQPQPEVAQDPQGQPADDPVDDAPVPAKERPHAPVGRPLEPVLRQARQAVEQFPGRVRVLMYTGSAAGAGWAFGLPQHFQAWITACGHDTSPGGALAFGTGLVLACGVLVDRRTRHWWGPLPWLCRIPLASALLALALYAPGVTQ